MYGIPYPEAKVRLDRLEEGLQILIGMFAGERFSFQGVHYVVDGAWNNPRPLQQPRPPIWVGGRSDRIARIAARYADWHNLGRTTLGGFRAKMELLDRTCEQLGRDPATLGRSRNPTLLLRESEAEFERYVAERAAARGVPPAEHLALLEEEGVIFGGPERVIETIQAFVEAGCACFQLIPRERDQEAALRRFAELVLPAFR
jgi:alkanesulfonate monooxygenase SsuD/methylene tetrahydromethanopterin reductase-like flavin-dependent oxidoreductase (luciferase family)